MNLRTIVAKVLFSCIWVRSTIGHILSDSDKYIILWNTILLNASLIANKRINSFFSLVKK